MEEISTMTIRSPLSGKSLMSGVGTTIINESLENKITKTSLSIRDVNLVQASSDDSGSPLTVGLGKTVSILAIAPTKMQHPAEAAGATVFVGAGDSNPAVPANSMASTPATWRRTTHPEIQTVNGYGTRQQEHKELNQQSQIAPVVGQLHPQQKQNQQQSTQTLQSAHHVVKIRINPEIDTGRVISTIRLNPDNNEERVTSTVKTTVNRSINEKNETIHDKDNSLDERLWTRRDDVARLNDRSIVNELTGQSESCVRISVVSGKVDKENIDNQHQENHRNLQDQHREAKLQNSKNPDQARETNDMVQQRGNTNESVNATSINRSSACFYYGSFPNSLTTMMMSSGQCSPSDTLDSGTCSDLDGTPPPLPKKKNSSTVLLGVSTTNGSPVIGSGVKGINTVGKQQQQQQQQQHNRAGSVTSSGPELDSDDNESNISCDSLNSGELGARIIEHQSIRVNGIAHSAVASIDDKIVNFESHDSKMKNSLDIITDKSSTSGNGSNVKVASAVQHECHEINENNNHSNDDKNSNSNNNNNNNNSNNNNNNKIEDVMSVNGTKNIVDEEMNERNNGNVGATNMTALPAEMISPSSSCSTRETSSASSTVSPSPSGASSLSKASSTPRVRSPVTNGHGASLVTSPVVKECTYEERKREQDRIDEENAAADYYANYNRKNGTKYLYDDDRFYKFHINENQSENENDDDATIKERENDEFFAGYKILDREAIRSAKGTVRGVKNRVRAGIATFLQKPSTKNYKTKDAGKIVVYTTSMSIVRETYFACIKMLQMLKTHMVKHEVRDMFMSRELQTELKERIGCETIEVPQLFIDGQYIGNADAVERLNESGELRRMFKPYKSSDACTTCNICGGCRLLPCQICNGSKKSPVRNDFMKEFYWLRCMNCDEVGLVRCKNC